MQWEKNVQPQVYKYQQLVREKYDQNLGSHVDYIRTAFGPYYEIARTNALQTYHELLLPSYHFVQPYAHQGYVAASEFTTGKAIPATLWAWNKTYNFLDATVWPQLKVIYVENVEPQLVKISQRLGRHNSSKKSIPKSAREAHTRYVPSVSQRLKQLTRDSVSSKTTSSFVKPTRSVPTAAVPPSVVPPNSSELPVDSSSSSDSSSSTASTSPSATVTGGSSFSRPASDTAHSIGSGTTLQPVSPPEIDEKLENEDPVRRSARETVAADLRDWQERYAKAAEESATEISNQVQELAKKMIRRNARVVGKSLVEQLQTSVISGLVTLRRDIVRIVGSVDKVSSAGQEGERKGVTPEEAQEEITRVIRKAGMSIKDKAQAVRAWRERYESELRTSITTTAETHFTILEDIRDLALQKIGMKWAWMDGVTYKDWAKYHQLKAKFEEWKGELQGLIVHHPSIEAAQLEGSKVEDEAMKVAANAARELARLKKAGGLKVILADDSPEFDEDVLQKAIDEAEAAKNSLETAHESTEIPGGTDLTQPENESAKAPVEVGSSQNAGEEATVLAEDVASVPEIPEEPIQVVGQESGSVAEPSTEQANVPTHVPAANDASTSSVTVISEATESGSLTTNEESTSSTQPKALDTSSTVPEPSPTPSLGEDASPSGTTNESAAPEATPLAKPEEGEAETKAEDRKDEL